MVGFVLAVGQTAGMDRALLVAAAAAYLFGVQLPTLRINVPLNNELQGLQVQRADRTGWRTARERFEARWNRWNRIRTFLATLTVAMLIVVSMRL